MSKGILAESMIAIHASPERVWEVITDPAAVKEFMFGADVQTDWREGSPIIWHGAWEGKPYEDKGEILEVAPAKKLVMTHFSPLAGDDDVPANYHTLTWLLEGQGDSTTLTLTQDNNRTEEAAGHSQEMWDGLVKIVKEIAERS
jgi:uncharacterized protein YndB with AHSA1/START domain